MRFINKIVQPNSSNVSVVLAFENIVPSWLSSLFFARLEDFAVRDSFLALLFDGECQFVTAP
jgi:hypothetical protein